VANFAKEKSVTNIIEYVLLIGGVAVATIALVLGLGAPM
jgi:Flp pilus assembly pilin Flp